MKQAKRVGSRHLSQLVECLLGQAHLCERIARHCADEESADKYLKLAKECKEGAELETAREAEAPAKAEWPSIALF